MLTAFLSTACEEMLLLAVLIIPVWIIMLVYYLLKWDSDTDFHASQTLSA